MTAYDTWKLEGYTAGRLARLTNIHVSTNPYGAGTSAAKAWAKGYKAGIAGA
jgi:hypothetical protein